MPGTTIRMKQSGLVALTADRLVVLTGLGFRGGGRKRKKVEKVPQKKGFDTKR